MHPAPLHLSGTTTHPQAPAVGPTLAHAAAGLSSNASVVGATALGLAEIPRADGPEVLARLAEGSPIVLVQARDWVLATDVLPSSTRVRAARLVSQALHHVPVASVPTRGVV